MKMNVKAMIVTMGVGVFCTLCGYVGGHTACAHQHVTTEEQNRMLLDDNGTPSNKMYIFRALRDYKRMVEDPFGLKKWLD